MLFSTCGQITAGRFNDKGSFKSHFEAPIKKAQQLSASDRVVALGSVRVRELQKIVQKFLLQRKKEDVLKDELLGKEVVIVYCEMTALQKEVTLYLFSMFPADATVVCLLEGCCTAVCFSAPSICLL